MLTYRRKKVLVVYALVIRFQVLLENVKTSL